MKINFKNKILFKFVFILSFFPFFVFAQSINIDAKSLVAKVEVYASPRSGSFVEGSTFEVPILVNTKKRSINGIEVRVNFNKDKLSIVNPTGGNSIIGVWVEPPKFDNTKGTASYVGVVPGGITTESGLIGTITFKAKASGGAVVSIGSDSKILLNDGLGTSAELEAGRSEYNILTKAPEGVQVFSETHPSQSEWYNNNSPVLSWVKDPNVSGFSFELDNRPNTIPDNTIDTIDTTKNYENLSDGLWYFHIKANKGSAWGTTGNFLLRIDTTPPAEFKPDTSYLVSTVALVDRTLISFFTTDNLSGIDHYEVGVIDKMQPATTSPIFIEAESPFQVPLNKESKFEVVVRAVDKAGNVRDESIAVETPFVITKFVKDYLVYILLGIIILGFIILVLHYLVGHHILRSIKRFRQILNNEDNQTDQIEEGKQIKDEKKDDNLPPPPVKNNPNNYIDKLN